MSDWRLRILPFILFTLGALVISRLFYWQILKGEELKVTAEKQHFESLEIPASRGEIKASDGSLLAGNQTAYLVYAELPKLKKSPQELAATLAPILAKSEKSTDSAQLNPELLISQKKKKLQDDLGRQDVVWGPLAHKVEESLKREIEKLGLLGLGFEREDRRYYP